MIVINIANDFGVETGARTYEDGKKSGQEFYEHYLKPNFEQAIRDKTKLKIILDGTDGLASSFLNEAFRRFGTEFGADNVWANLILISTEVPKYIIKIKESLYEGEK
jgi:phosphomannomutase